MILLEAMAHGIPVVAHAVGGIPDVLNQGDCGILVTDHSPNGYADAIFRLLTDTRLKNEIVSGAMQRVTTYYNAELNARRYLACYLSAYQQAAP
jgi:glycosyltransferase involved in cell wall biosynthesis